MPASRIVEALDVVEHVGPRGISRPVDLGCRALGLECREEAFHRGVVPDVARARQRADDAMLGHQPLAMLARILAAAIGVMQQLARRLRAAAGHRRRRVDAADAVQLVVGEVVREALHQVAAARVSGTFSVCAASIIDLLAQCYDCSILSKNRSKVLNKNSTLAALDFVTISGINMPAPELPLS